MLQRVRAIWPVLLMVTSLVISIPDTATVKPTSCHTIAANAETVSTSFLHFTSLARYATKRTVVTNSYS